MNLEAHSSTLAGWWYCGYRCIEQLKGVHGAKTPAVKFGGTFHDWLADRPVGPDIAKLKASLSRFKVTSKIRPGYFFHRPFKDMDVYGDIDAFTLDPFKRFRIIEYKTLRHHWLLTRWWYASPYVFQVNLYAWILEPVLAKLGLELSPRHRIEWYSSRTGFPPEDIDSEQMHPVTWVSYDPWKVEKDLERIQQAYADPAKIIYPTLGWKCRNCDPVFKSTCSKWKK